MNRSRIALFALRILPVLSRMETSSVSALKDCSHSSFAARQADSEWPRSVCASSNSAIRLRNSLISCKDDCSVERSWFMRQPKQRGSGLAMPHPETHQLAVAGRGLCVSLQDLTLN